MLREFDDESKNRIYTGPAKRLLEKLAPMSSHVETYQKRWFWELVQNACDYNDNVRVELEITSEFIHFRHNGSAFKMDQVLNLIFPNSDKDETKDREVIGQYGSGFISTHILSSQIAVKGILTSKENEMFSFKFSLDRTHREEKTMLAESLQKSELEFKNSLQAAAISKDQIYTTQFSYTLNSSYVFVDSKQTIEKGRIFIEEVLPYVFAFQEKLVEVCITEGQNKSIFSCSSRRESEVVISIIDYQNDLPQETASVTIKICKYQETFVAIEVEDSKVKALSKNFPRLSKAYPLIGTEEFPFPCVVHSLDLIPTLERNAIELSDNDANNRQVLQGAVKAYGMLVDLLSKENFSCIYNVCELTPGSFDTKIQEWFKVNVSDKLKEKLLTTTVVPTNTSRRANLKEIKIPILENEHYQAYYKLVSKTIFPIPLEEEAIQWGKTLNFSVFTDTKFDFKNLLNSLLGQKKAVNEFLQENVNVFEWVKELIHVILVSDEKDLLYEKAIIPQQDNKLRPLKSELFWDDEIHEELKDILELISEESYRKILMHKTLEEIGDKLLDPKKEKSEKDILDAIDKALQSAAAKEQSPKFLDALRRILKWTSKFEDAELKTKMPWFAGERALLVMRTLASEENRDMAFKIIQSGKMEVLAQLAESNVSPERLNSIIELSKSAVSLESLVEIALIADEVPMKEILESVKELQVEAVDKAFKTEQGTSIETLVENLLNEDGLDKIYKCTLKGFGESDFIITNLKNGKEAFLEIKSHAYGSQLPSKLYASQAKKAVACISTDNFILGVITRPKERENNVTEYIRDQMRFTFGIGQKLKPLVDQYIQLEPFQSGEGGVSVEFEKKDVKFTIDRQLTDKGYPFGGFKVRLKQILDK